MNKPWGIEACKPLGSMPADFLLASDAGSKFWAARSLHLANGLLPLGSSSDDRESSDAHQCTGMLAITMALRELILCAFRFQDPAEVGTYRLAG